MAAKSNLSGMALCLSLVCLVCGAVLGSVYAVTKSPIEAAAAAEAKAAIAEVLPEGGEISEAREAEGMEYYCSVADSAVVAYAVRSSAVGFGGPLTLMVGVLPDGSIWNTKVLSHSETPGLGAKCTTDEGFMAQWKGFKGDFSVRKDGGDVDAITASTITSRAYAKAVAQASALVVRLHGGDAVTGASVNDKED
ncbi:MAG: RnfABCDGE type electron transport complex subunit G [Bacteroidales bacterium]|nr:RnfABCDGE type electron transport complex subunit G [Bacteroidales bacterium]